MIQVNLEKYIDRYCDWMLERNYSPLTVKQKQYHLQYFAAWCAERSVTDIGAVTKSMLDRYQRHLFYRKKADNKKVGDDKPLSFKTQRAHMVSLQVFFKWLCKKGLLTSDPCSGIDLPQIGNTLPRAILSQSELAAIFSQPDVGKVFGKRDRAILETLYSTGLRRAELINLAVYDIDKTNGTVFVRQGKGKKDRVVPIGNTAQRWVEKYQREARSLLETSSTERALFLGHRGEPLTKGALGNLVKKHMVTAGIDKVGACHLFRHTMASDMLRNGADIRYIQVILGHSKLETTQVYTHVTIEKLKEIHSATHPAEIQ